MSYSRPDPASPAAIADAAFATGRRGFDQTEVREFLRMVAAELGRLQERERFLERELRQAQSNPDLERMQLDDQTLTRLLGEETVRVLAAARESSSEIRAKAEASAAQLLAEAADEAVRVRQEADVEASRRRADAASDAEAELSMAKQQGREMVNEARAYRERVLSELARRRELAREQIEQLLHGRDRLMQSFERARLAAVDVVAELEPLGPPDEYVDLTPTTGPVPLTVPASRRPSATSGHRAPTTDHPSTSDTVDDTTTDTDTTSTDTTSTDTASTDTTSTATEPQIDEATGDARVDDGPADDDDPESGVSSSDADSGGDDGDSTSAAEGDDGGSDDADGDAIETVDESGAIDADDGAVAVAEPADRADVAGGDTPVDDEDQGDDDVVVDLFARLRAETTDDTSADGASATDIAADTAGDEVGDDVVVDDAPPSAFAARDVAITPLIVAAGRSLKRALADEQNDALDALRRNGADVSVADVFPDGEADDALAVALVEPITAAAHAGAVFAAGDDAETPESAVGAADEVLRTAIIAPLRERIERAVIDADGDARALTTAVRALYREWKTQHIDEHLDDVLCTAYGFGLVAALPEGTPVVWTTDPGHPGTADCDDNALAGAVALGDAFPTGDRMAPSHSGCRCLLLPTDG